MTTSDADLVRTAQEGDATSLGVLLERHRAPLHAMALGILDYGPEAQDAVQDTFLIALRRIDQVREAEAFGGWLRTVLRSVCYAQLRRQRTERAAANVIATMEHTAATPVEASIDQLALRDWVWTAIAELPETLRATAMLRYFGTYASYEEIAAILGVPVGTVRSRLNQARRTLGEALLRTADRAHDDTRTVREQQSRFFLDAFDRYNRQREYGTLISTHAPGLVWAYPDGTVQRHPMWPRWVYESDLEADMRMIPTNVIPGSGVTIVELEFVNPPDDPFHCPPATSMIYFHRDDGVHTVRQYYAPRPPAQ